MSYIRPRGTGGKSLFLRRSVSQVEPGSRPGSIPAAVIQAGSALAFVAPPLAQAGEEGGGGREGKGGIYLNCLPSNVFVSGWQRSSGCLISKCSLSQMDRCIVTKGNQSWSYKAGSDRPNETVTDFFSSGP